jgi:hypothetical protein
MVKMAGLDVVKCYAGWDRAEFTGDSRTTPNHPRWTAAIAGDGRGAGERLECHVELVAMACLAWSSR